MKAVVIGDSHVAELEKYFRQIDPSWTVMTVKVGRSTDLVREKYRGVAHLVKDFRPDVAYLNVGHNNVVRHGIHNPVPVEPFTAFKNCMLFMDEVMYDLPSTEVVYSSLLPRSDGPRMTYAAKKAYNVMAYEYGELVTDVCMEEGRHFVLNHKLSYSPIDGTEHPVYFCKDGLHLNYIGKDALVSEWIAACPTH
jgi:hypothetical protein